MVANIKPYCAHIGMLCAAVVALPAAGNAQDLPASEGAQVATPIAPDTIEVRKDAAVQFSADSVSYEGDNSTVIATGSVELKRDGTVLTANKVSWNRNTGVVTAMGNVIIRNPGGDVLYGETIELTDSLKDGVINDLLVVLDGNARLAAKRGTRLENGDLVLENVAYTPCAVADANDCPKTPSWQIKANKVRYDKAGNRVRYTGARVELFGLPLIPLPGLAHQAQDQAGTGFLVPGIRIDRTNGLELELPYYLRFGPNHDLTVTGHIYTGALPMAGAQYRKLTQKGAFQISGNATYSRRLSASTGGSTAGNAFRGYLEGIGKFQIDPLWSITGSTRVVSDRTFLRRYDISRDDRLRTNLDIERIGGSSYFSIAGWAVQTLRANDNQGQQAIALPQIDYRQRFADPWAGGRFEIQLNSLAVGRTNGQDTQRAFAGIRWDYRRLTPSGQEITVTALGRGDVYHSDENLLTQVPSYRGKGGWQGRVFGAAAADIRWPLIGPAFGGTQRITPRAQIATSTPVRNISIPNEDSRAFELEDSNIFALNRFPGYDRFEDGTRLTYGVEYAFDKPGWSVSTQIAQSYRIQNKPSLFPNGTGLTTRSSDVVGRTSVAYKDFVRLTHRFRLDKDNFAVRRNELDLTVGSRKNYMEIGYLRLNRDITQLAEDLRDREEVRAGARFSFAKNWSVFGSAIVDLSGRSEDASLNTDGFSPIRHRLGIAYEDDCITFGLTWRRDYEDSGDARRGNSFLLRVAFRNLGV
jgi:LPS-assembly protein